MSAAERLSKLEALLARVQRRRHEARPLRVAEVVASDDEPDVDLDLSTLPPDEVVPASEPAAPPRRETAEESFGDLRSSAPPAERGKASEAPASLTGGREPPATPKPATTNGAGTLPPPADEPRGHASSARPAGQSEADREATGEGAPAAAARPRAITLPEAPPVQAVTEPTAKHGHVVPQASGPVAHSEGELPPTPADGFEALIARSLALRPRG